MGKSIEEMRQWLEDRSKEVDIGDQKLIDMYNSKSEADLLERFSTIDSATLISLVNDMLLVREEYKFCAVAKQKTPDVWNRPGIQSYELLKAVWL